MSRHASLVSRALLGLALLSLAAGQAEQSIFAQFLYAPALAAKETTRKPTQVILTTTDQTSEGPITEEPTTEEPTTEGLLDVLPLLTRGRRSGFSREPYAGGNDLIVNRFRTKLADPGWVPEIYPRFGGGKSSEAAEHESGNWAGVKH